MNNPNKLTGETVLEKLKYYLIDIEKDIVVCEHANIHARELFNKRDDFKWCIEQANACTCLGGDCKKEGY